MNYIFSQKIEFHPDRQTIPNMSSALKFIKDNVQWSEYYIQRIVYDQGVVNTPFIYEYNHDTKQMTMQKIPQMCIADMYGDKDTDIPLYLWKTIRDIFIKIRAIGINYPDITPYNFIECGKQVWIIDFGHASIRTKDTEEFMLKFIGGYNGWNPEYR